MKWIVELIGKPWRAEAGGPDAYDCKGLVSHVLREHLRLPVPTLLDVAAPRDFIDARSSALEAGWRPVAGRVAREGDVLLVHAARGAHVGVFVRYGTRLGVLHSVQPPAMATGVRFDRFDDILVGGFGRPTIWRHCG